MAEKLSQEDAARLVYAHDCSLQATAQYASFGSTRNKRAAYRAEKKWQDLIATLTEPEPGA
jgi:hypothetical protein